VRRSGPATVTFTLRSAHLARAWRPGPARVARQPGTLRRGPAAADGRGAVRGSRRGRRALVRRTRRSCRPATARPRQPWPPPGSARPLYSPSDARA